MAGCFVDVSERGLNVSEGCMGVEEVYKPGQSSSFFKKKIPENLHCFRNQLYLLALVV